MEHALTSVLLVVAARPLQTKQCVRRRVEVAVAVALLALILVAQLLLLLVFFI